MERIDPRDPRYLKEPNLCKCERCYNGKIYSNEKGKEISEKDFFELNELTFSQNCPECEGYGYC